MATATLTKLQELHRRRARRRRRRRHRGGAQPRDRRADRRGAALERRGRRPRGGGGAPRVRDLVAHDPARALRAPARASPSSSTTTSRSWPADRVRRGRQADRDGARGGDAGQLRPPALLRRRGAADGGQGLRRVRREPHLDDPARAGGRRRSDHPVELPALDGRVEDRPGARDRQHDRPEAGREHPDGHAAAGRAGRGHPPAGRAQRDRRPRRARRARRSSATPTST